MSQCRSFGSNYRPSSKSRKISIGIVVDRSAKTKASDIREDAAAVPITGNLGSSKVNITEDTHKNKKVKDPSNENLTEATIHVLSSQGVCDVKQASSSLLNQCQRSNGANNSQQHSLQFTLNQMSVLQSDDGLQKKFNSVTYGRKGQRDGSSNMVEEVSFATAEGLKVPVEKVVREKPENAEKKGNETLRMKIWEVLGTVSTPIEQFCNSQTIKTGTDNLEPEWKSDKKKGTTVKPRHNSDTVELSDSPNHTMKRPVTRSLTRKRPIKVQQPKTQNAPSSSDKHKHPEKDIFSFKEGWSRRITSVTIGGSSVSKTEKKKSSRIEPRKLHFSKRNNADESCQVTDTGKTNGHIEGSSGLKNSMGKFCAFSLNENRDSYHSPFMDKTDKLGDNYESVFPKSVDEQEDVVDPSLKNTIEPQFDFNTPTIGKNPPTESYFGGSSPKNNEGKREDVHSPIKGVLNMENISSFKSFFASNPDNDKENKEAEVSDDEVEHEDSSVEKSLPNLKENDTAKSPSTSLSEQDGSESCDKGSPTEGPSEAETPEILFRPTKRCRINEGADATIFSSPSTSLKVSKKFHELPSELNEENELARAVSLFAMILERVKSKMNLVANKRSAEILTSVALDMHVQLQNAESQIQKDVGKLIGIGKTKRRHVETRFQEKQEQLKDIYERFRNEVNLHLQDCRSTLEGLESQQTEFKDIVEKQKASHGKILLQVEEAIKTQLNDAQRRITTVHKSTRAKMHQLKHVIAECLKEDVIY